MRLSRAGVFLVLPSLLAGVPAITQAQSFEHVVVVVQENRTPDNLFQGLCTLPVLCSTTPKGSQYNIRTSRWLDKTQPGGVIEPLPVPLASAYDLEHSHEAFISQCDLNSQTRKCVMDGGASVPCVGTCMSQPSFRFVDNSTGILDPYLELARQYGWANYMFQTNQGPSFPAHQFLFGGTSAPSAADDAAAVFVSSNVQNGAGAGGCVSPAGAIVDLITPPGLETGKMFPCFEHDTIPDVLPAHVSWKYYSSFEGSIWTAPNAIRHICQPSPAEGGKCLGPEWKSHIDSSPDVLVNIEKCTLPNLSWVTPSGQNSDHAEVNTGGGPAWVASIVNAIGATTCKDASGKTYWEDTAILILWDDWGGWYDHEPPTILPQPQGDYQYGFRVPLIVVSAFTPAHTVDNNRYEFGSVLRFIEHNFGVSEGILNFADGRADNALAGLFDMRLVPRPFVKIASPVGADFFINDKTPPTDPDDD